MAWQLAWVSACGSVALLVMAEAAGSLAGLMITTECLISDICCVRKSNKKRETLQSPFADLKAG